MAGAEGGKPGGEGLVKGMRALLLCLVRCRGLRRSRAGHGPIRHWRGSRAHRRRAAMSSAKAELNCRSQSASQARDRRRVRGGVKRMSDSGEPFRFHDATLFHRQRRQSMRAGVRWPGDPAERTQHPCLPRGVSTPGRHRSLVRRPRHWPRCLAQGGIAAQVELACLFGHAAQVRRVARDSGGLMN